MTDKPTVIFDIDGTLADIEHRRHHVANKPKNWVAFNEAMGADTPKPPIVKLLQTLHAAGNFIVLCSGRENEYRRLTESWMLHHGIPYHDLYMRFERDYRRDDIIKGELLDQILKDGYEPWLVVDDRNQVVDMWRKRGLTCLQCAEGNF